jgi:hypothetical protein
MRNWSNLANVFWLIAASGDASDAFCTSPTRSLASCSMDARWSASCSAMLPVGVPATASAPTGMPPDALGLEPPSTSRFA